jgi:ABC-type sugar transport system ATPase subunit
MIAFFIFAIVLFDEIKNYKKPSEAIADGVIYLPEERDEEGLVLDMTVGDNLVISSLKNLMSGIFINLKKKKIVVNDLIKLLEITTTSDLQEVKHLSGGNRQKVVFGKIIATRPKVFLLDEPTKGIDVPTKQNILKLIKEKLGKNTSILMSSPGLEEIIKICDRIIVLYQGQIIRVFNKDEFDEEVIYLSIQKENNSVKK